jgi:aspartyl-tRNA(Asn)/glutamyl-tRNA(Gln) amidotransferase subunit A
MASELNKLTIAEASAMLRKREISALELTRDCLERIAAAEPKLNAFITVCEKEATAQARQADARLATKDAPPLCGIPLGIKDI